MTQLGNCQVDNQGNPVPSVGSSCNLAGMHLDAGVIDTPEASELYGNGLMNNGMLDWEFYGVNQRPSAGANPASQNDFYGNLYSLASFYGSQGGAMDYQVDAPMVETVNQIKMVEKPCNCGSEGAVTHSKKQLYMFVALIVGAYLIAKK